MTESLPLLVLSAADVRAALPMENCIDALHHAICALDEGDAINPLRSKMALSAGNGLLGLMPAEISSIGMTGIKIVTVLPGNHGTEYDSHQGGVFLFETERGQPLALADAAEITAIRTGAASALATRALARNGAGDLAIIGSGVQARSHLAALMADRTLRRIQVWSRNPIHAQRFAQQAGGRHRITIEIAASVEEAVTQADIICTTTSAAEPILKGDWVQSGTHINAVGSSVPHTREVDSALIQKSSVFVDRRESALNEAGDLLFPIQEKCFAAEDIRAELGEVLNGKKRGRQSAEEITLFKSLGLGIYDLIAIHQSYIKAQELGLGVTVPFGELRNV
ncbi:MAG: ornithine cyclodeaminase family protein [Chloroflexi bacterium]|nr:ornithine cyclodeaminase family protein [Chloroflexota bacterium]